MHCAVAKLKSAASELIFLMMIRGPAQCSESYELIWIVNGWQLIKMEAVEGIVKIGDKEELKIGDLMKKEKRQNGC